MKLKAATLFIGLMSIVSIPFFSFAGVVMLGTRLIINEGDQYGEVKLKNYGDQPELVQVWIDNSTVPANSPHKSAQLIPTPSVFRVGAHGEQSVRVNLINDALPKDRESLFWFNFLQIFPKGNKAANSMDFSLINAVKIFYRPASLRVLDRNISEYMKAKLNYQGKILTINNSSPYHINLSGTARYGLEQVCQLDVDGEIIKPFSELRKSINKNSCHAQTLSVKIIDDNGRISEQSIPIH